MDDIGTNLFGPIFTSEPENGIYEKLGMSRPDDVVVLNRIQWTDFTVE